MEAWSSGVLTSVLGVDEPSMAKMAIDLIVFSSTLDTRKGMSGSDITREALLRR